MIEMSEEKFYELLDSLEKSGWKLSHKSGSEVYLMRKYSLLGHKCSVAVSVNEKSPEISLRYLVFKPPSLKLAKALKEIFGDYAAVVRREDRIDVMLLANEVYSDVDELEDRIDEVLDEIRKEVSKVKVEVIDFSSNLMKEGFLVYRSKSELKFRKVFNLPKAILRIEGSIDKNTITLDLFIIGDESEANRIEKILKELGFTILKDLTSSGVASIKATTFYTDIDSAVNTLVSLRDTLEGKSRQQYIT